MFLDFDDVETSSRKVKKVKKNNVEELSKVFQELHLKAKDQKSVPTTDLFLKRIGKTDEIREQIENIMEEKREQLRHKNRQKILSDNRTTFLKSSEEADEINNSSEKNSKSEGYKKIMGLINKAKEEEKEEENKNKEKQLNSRNKRKTDRKLKIFDLDYNQDRQTILCNQNALLVE